jgi:hypothetical protein
MAVTSSHRCAPRRVSLALPSRGSVQQMPLSVPRPRGREGIVRAFTRISVSWVAPPAGELLRSAREAAATPALRIPICGPIGASLPPVVCRGPLPTEAVAALAPGVLVTMGTSPEGVASLTFPAKCLRYRTFLADRPRQGGFPATEWFAERLRGRSPRRSGGVTTGCRRAAARHQPLRRAAPGCHVGKEHGVHG